jgi:hypothetical protein
LFGGFFSCRTEVDSPEIELETLTFDSVSVDSSFNDESQDGLMLLETEQYTSESFYTEGIGWGYRILNQGAPYINQPHIPAVSGVNGFESEQDALITANFAIYKINNGIVPPTISKTELDSLGVLPQ